MDLREFEQLFQEAKSNVIDVSDLKNHIPRTLVYGYNSDNTTFHVYLGPDNLIHVLTYWKVYNEANEEDFRVRSHSSGVSGGVDKNTDYVPEKKVYAEGSDFEFCKLLLKNDVDMSFLPFSGMFCANRRVAAHGGYAGYTLDQGGGTGVDLHDALLGEIYPRVCVESKSRHDMQRDRKLTTRLIVQACRELDVSRVLGEMDSVLVDKEKADQVQSKARELFCALPKNLLFEEDLAQSLFAKVFWPNFYLRAESTFGDGNLTTFTAGHRNLTAQVSEDLIRFVCRTDSVWEDAFCGSYKGRPFVVVMNRTRMEITCCTFGSPEGFAQKIQNWYHLSPVEASPS